MRIKKGICVYRKINNLFKDDFFDSWSTIEKYNEAYLENLYTSEDMREMWLFDINKNKLTKEDYNYPIVVCYSETYYDEVFQENYSIETFKLIKNKEELESIKENIQYIFELKDDILEEVLTELKHNQEEFEKYLMRTENFSGDIIITDPCYIIPSHIKEDYSYYNLEELGFTSYLCHSTLYGDWSCHTFNSDTDEILGRFCADAGMVGVFLREEVLRIYPEFEKNYNSYCYTLIKDFKGTIKFELLDDRTIIVKGNGNINFETRQTGL